MEDYIEFELNGISYSAGLIPSGEFRGWFCWNNDWREEGEAMTTLLHAQQDAIAWEGGRDDRGRQDEAEEEAGRRYELEQRLNRIGGYP